MSSEAYNWAEYQAGLGTLLSTAIGIPESAIALGFERFAPVRVGLLMLVIGLAFSYAQRRQTAEQGTVDQDRP